MSKYTTAMKEGVMHRIFLCPKCNNNTEARMSTAITSKSSNGVYRHVCKHCKEQYLVDFEKQATMVWFSFTDKET